ncbi:MAG: hypothetical protein IJ583_14230 [Firmicutes bacterium]|nr:hypothetical protein [Bacillota bacterium]
MKTYENGASVKIMQGKTYMTKFGKIKVIRLSDDDITVLKDSIISHMRIQFLYSILTVD